ncbi:hypothetical protein F5146DRAFT_1140935 [Armillaria mellea]|nr:hypothetical protein F5146DRAFT_1140935 [Armillaria mellea]
MPTRWEFDIRSGFLIDHGQHDDFFFEEDVSATVEYTDTVCFIFPQRAVDNSCRDFLGIEPALIASFNSRFCCISLVASLFPQIRVLAVFLALVLIHRTQSQSSLHHPNY